MKTILKFVITALIITSLAITTISAIDSADSTQYNTLDQTKNFLSNVIGLDLTKYSLTPSPYQLRYNNTANTTRVPDETIYRPDEASGYKREGPIYRFVYDNSTIDVLSIFYNGQLVVVNIYPINNNASYTYASKPGDNLTDQASTLLIRYAEFMSQKSGADTSFLTTMKNVLSSVNTESSAINTTIGNINFQASKNENNVTRLQWIYVEYDTIMNRKRVEIEFKNGDLETFRDTWSLYKVAGPNVLSAEQARKIALDAAHKLLLNISTGDGKIETIKAPDLSNALYDVQFSMSPCQGQVAKELSLDPFTLYPFWHFNFFNETIAGAEGIQVGVLGDTGAVFSTGIFGYLGNPTTANGTPTITSATNTSLDLVLIAAATTALMLIVSVPIALRHKIRQRK